MNLIRTRELALVCFALVLSPTIALAGTGGPGPATDGVGIYQTTGAHTFWLNNELDNGPADIDFRLLGTNLTGLVGDWDGDGVEGSGLYDPATGSFFLTDALATGGTPIMFQFGGGGAVVPIVGNFDQDPNDEVGVYNPATGEFSIRLSFTTGPADFSFNFGPGGGGFVPITGNWDNGADPDGVGIYDPTNGNFWLRNDLSTGPFDTLVTFGPGPGFTPVVGNWSGTAEGIGIYDDNNGNFWLRNTLVNGPADEAFTFGPGTDFRPLSGRWEAAP